MDLWADEETWQVQYFLIHLFQELPHREFLIATKWVKEIDCKGKWIESDLMKDQIRNEPEFDPFLLVEMGHEANLYEE